MNQMPTPSYPPPAPAILTALLSPFGLNPKQVILLNPLFPFIVATRNSGFPVRVTSLTLITLSTCYSISFSNSSLISKILPLEPTICYLLWTCFHFLALKKNLVSLSKTILPLQVSINVCFFTSALSLGFKVGLALSILFRVIFKTISDHSLLFLSNHPHHPDLNLMITDW